MSCRLSLVLWLFVWFRFRLFAFTEAAALRSIVLRSSTCMCPDSHMQLPNNMSASFFVFVSSFFKVSLEMWLFQVFWYVVRSDGGFLPCDDGLDFGHQLIIRIIEFSHNKLMSKIQPMITR